MNPASWQPVLDELMGRVAARFGRVEPRRTARAFVTGLLSGAERKNCWWLAEWAGHRSPDAMQRQYTGTAGRIENTQVGVFVAYVSPRGRALIDRALYLPRSWAGDPDRCRAAGIPARTVFASKPALARQMLARALDAVVPAAWVTADEVYGADPALRADLERRGTSYVLAVACHRRVISGRITIRADELASRLPARAWQQLSPGQGAKGPRCYDWAWADLDGRACRWLLVRRHPGTGKLAFYLCWAPRAVPLATLVRVAGSRWAIEESFQAGQGAGRAGPLPGPRLGAVAPVCHSGHARPGLPGGDRCHHLARARSGPRQPAHVRAEHGRDPPSSPSAADRLTPAGRRHAGMVGLAAIPGPRPPLPLPAKTGHHRHRPRAARCCHSTPP